MVLLTTVVLSLSFYLRDKKMLLNQAHEKARLVQTGLLSTMMASGDPAVVKATIDTFKQQKTDFTFRMIESKYVWRQYGSKDNALPSDQIEEDVLSGKLAEYSDLTWSTLRFVTPFVTDERCGKCHQEMDGSPLAPGKVNGVAEFVYDVTEWRNTGMRLMAETDFLIILIMAATGRPGPAQGDNKRHNGHGNWENGKPRNGRGKQHGNRHPPKRGENNGRLPGGKAEGARKGAVGRAGKNRANKGFCDEQGRPARHYQPGRRFVHH
jgi:hypothetical protein